MRITKKRDEAKRLCRERWGIAQAPFLFVSIKAPLFFFSISHNYCQPFHYWKVQPKTKKIYLLNCHLVLDIKTIKTLITFCLGKTALKRNDKVLIMF